MPVGLKIESQVCRAFQPPLQSSIDLSVVFGPKATGTPSGGVRNVYRRILLISADDLGLLDDGSTYFSGKPSGENLKQTGRTFFDSIINGWGAVLVYQMPQTPKTRQLPCFRRLLLFNLYRMRHLRW